MFFGKFMKIAEHQGHHYVRPNKPRAPNDLLSPDPHLLARRPVNFLESLERILAINTLIAWRT
jgi:hypothetical protein